MAWFLFGLGLIVHVWVLIWFVADGKSSDSSRRPSVPSPEYLRALRELEDIDRMYGIDPEKLELAGQTPAPASTGAFRVQSEAITREQWRSHDALRKQQDRAIQQYRFHSKTRQCGLCRQDHEMVVRHWGQHELNKPDPPCCWRS